MKRKKYINKMLDSNKTIQGLWVDGQISTLQWLCIKSFIANSHIFHLYTYNKKINVPEGTVIKNAEEIILHNHVFLDSRGTLAGFSDWFRYELLYKRGGWWVDVDQFCIKPFDFDCDYVFSSEHLINSSAHTVNVGVIKAPPQSDIMDYCLKNVKNMNLSDGLPWGAVGSRIFNSYIENNKNYYKYLQLPHVFCPIPYFHYNLLFEDKIIELPEETYGVHFWNEMLRINGLNPNSKFHDNSFYEKLKKKLL